MRLMRGRSSNGHGSLRLLQMLQIWRVLLLHDYRLHELVRVLRWKYSVLIEKINYWLLSSSVSLFSCCLIFSCFLRGGEAFSKFGCLLFFSLSLSSLLQAREHVIWREDDLPSTYKIAEEQRILACGWNSRDCGGRAGAGEWRDRHGARWSDRDGRAGSAS